MALHCGRLLLLLLIALTAADATPQAESKHARRLLQDLPSPLYSPAPSLANLTGPTTVRLEIGPLRQYW
jgi:hypothetical protein